MILLYPNWQPREPWQSMLTILIKTDSEEVDYAKLRSIASVEIAATFIRNDDWAVLRVDPFDPDDRTQYDAYRFADWV